MTRASWGKRADAVRDRTEKLGYVLRRKRNPHPEAAPNRYGYIAMKADVNAAVGGHEPFAFAWTIDDVEQWLATHE